MNWTFKNGQWFNNGQPSITPPPEGTPYWSVDVNGHQDFLTYAGPESMTGVGTPINPTLPRNGTTVPAPTPQRPYQVRTPVASDSNTGGPPVTTPPPVPPGMPPAALPPIRPVNPRVPTVVGATRPGNIPNNVFWDPDAAAPPGFSEDKWANRFIVNSAQNANAFGPLSEGGLTLHPDARDVQPTEDEVFKAQLSKNYSGITDPRERVIAAAILNPSSINAASLPQAVTGGKGGGGTNPAQLAANLYDWEQDIAAQKEAARLKREEELADPNSWTNMARRLMRGGGAGSNLPPPPAPPPYAGNNQPEGQVYTNPDGSLGVSLSADDSLLGAGQPGNFASALNAVTNSALTPMQQQVVARSKMARYAGGTMKNAFAPSRSALQTPPMTLGPTRSIPGGKMQTPTARPIPSMPMPQFPTPAPTYPVGGWHGMPAPVTPTPAPVMGRGLVPRTQALPNLFADPRNRAPIYQQVRRGYGANNAPFR